MSALPLLAHLAIIVRDLDAQTVVPLAPLGLAVRDRTTVPGEGVEVAFVSAGGADIELIQPRSTGGPLGRFLEGRGEGVHHVALRVANIETAIAAATAAGLRLAGPAPRDGAQGAKIAFLHPSSLNGVLVELVERR